METPSCDQMCGEVNSAVCFLCVPVCMYVCDLTDLAGALSGEVNRPKPGANVLVGVWERLIRTRSKRL